MLWPKKKVHFLELAFLFGAITLLSLLSQWGYSRPVETGSDMMSGSMGNMMLSMHGSGATLADLFRQEEASDTDVSGGSHQSHHSSRLSLIHYITTMTVIVLLPLIIAGSLFLAAVWVK